MLGKPPHGMPLRMDNLQLLKANMTGFFYTSRENELKEIGGTTIPGCFIYQTERTRGKDTQDESTRFISVANG